MEEFELGDPVNNANSMPKMQGLNTSFAIKNKWVMYVPLKSILPESFENIELNLTKFNLPQIQMNSTSTSFRGYTVELPTKLVNSDTKELTLEYIIDERWTAYKALYCWAAGIGIFVPLTEASSDISNTAGAAVNMIDPNRLPILDCRIWLMDSYKKRIIDFVFRDCWIKNFSELDLDYSNTDEVHHRFTVAYSKFEIADVISVG